MGYGLIIPAAFLYNSQTPFPGVAAAIPVLGTPLVIAFGPDNAPLVTQSGDSLQTCAIHR